MIFGYKEQEREREREREGSLDKVIWVDSQMKRCDPRHVGARRAVYNETYDLYVIDKPKVQEGGRWG